MKKLSIGDFVSIVENGDNGKFQIIDIDHGRYQLMIGDKLSNFYRDEIKPFGEEEDKYKRDYPLFTAGEVVTLDHGKQKNIQAAILDVVQLSDYWFYKIWDDGYPVPESDIIPIEDERDKRFFCPLCSNDISRNNIFFHLNEHELRYDVVDYSKDRRKYLCKCGHELHYSKLKCDNIRLRFINHLCLAATAGNLSSHIGRFADYHALAREILK